MFAFLQYLAAHDQTSELAAQVAAAYQATCRDRARSGAVRCAA
ncbi:MAG: hypothetical protein ACXWA9_03160 [Acidimicrobiia bacterium]